MDAKAIEAHGRDLNKAQASSDVPTDKIINLLSELRAGVRATEDILRSTKIGVTVNRLKAHKNPEVARQASEIISKWRADVKKGGSGAKATPVSPKSNGRTATNAGVNGNGTSEVKSSVAPEKRTSETDSVNVNQTGNSVRDNCLRLMYDGLAFMSSESPSSILPVATSIESAAFTLLAPETSEPYKTKMRSLFMNLKSKSNPQLRVRVLSGEISPHRFVRMKAEELRSPERRAEDQAMQKENMDKAMVAQVEKSISSSLTCGKCGKKKVSYSQAQTRSADEPMTTFCECQVCGNRWKFC